VTGRAHIETGIGFCVTTGKKRRRLPTKRSEFRMHIAGGSRSSATAAFLPIRGFQAKEISAKEWDRREIASTPHGFIERATKELGGVKFLVTPFPALNQKEAHAAR
jgi:hypothetical protein